MEIKKVGLASDHAGYPLKKFVEQYLEEKGYPVQDYGCWSDTSVDYPDYAHALAEGIEDGICNVGIGICGSGEGMAIALNKHQAVRAGLAWCPEVAGLCRQHNDANVIVLPGRFLNNNEAEKILDTFFKTNFEAGRHQRRVEKISGKFKLVFDK
ncbi:ribose 5-phosphate isomerase B [Prevotella sp. PINT]|uniref:ribose 5-phosphate isomerase B n=1 Tax=Palleniella intestinalis TaxID=2736291 RepID=UPI001556F835|nr:ribose 5-phosphate isomerase B [Palleniella intestinalis]NPD80641.1 ribose 5-phosphate isomerase B [Palleniella intestinalis]